MENVTQSIFQRKHYDLDGRFHGDILQDIALHFIGMQWGYS